MDGKIEETTGEELSGRNGKVNGSTNGLNGTNVTKGTNGITGSNGLNGKNEPNGTNGSALPQAVLMTQQSTVALRKQQAVCVRRAYKMYGSKATPNIILDGLNMTVPKGAIYGLLGASGCGKTTLLSCIVGRRRLNGGEIWVLGGHPGSRGSGVPGPRIGYMPQEVALYGEFTLKESLKYFGMIAGMNPQQIEDRTDYLLKLLQLPDENRFVKNLSGGQQRRMSLAAALLHEPELLILDEPTVGVDPILRQNVWDHLVEITKNGNTTVIITTHYIDETRQANIIGLLRGGRMLAEQSPDHLLREHNAESLEEVFLKLAVYQNMGKRRRSSIAHEITERIESTAVANPALDISDEGPCEISGEFGDNISMTSRALENVTAELPAPPLPVEEEEQPMDCAKQISSVVSSHRMKALMWKNFLWMWRNVGVMLFILGLPVMQIVIFCVSIGHRPVDLKLAVANDELDSDMLRMQECPVIHGCNYTYLSCRYLELLKNKSIIVEFFETEEEANNAVKRGKAWAAMTFASNYSDSLIERTNSGQNAEDPTIEASEVSVRLDMSNKQISTLLYRDIQFTFFDFVENILTDCDINPKVGRVPIDWKPPVYGDQHPNFRDFAAPGVILTIIFFVSVASTSGAMLIERNEGMLERCLVAGITSTEILFSQVVTQFTLMISQTFLVIIFSFFIFDITIRGDLGLVVLLCMLNGLCGMSFGFVISCAVHTERTATYIALGSFIPIITLCGIIWPIEGMYHLLQIAAFFLPLTKSTESMRSMLQRGWSISQPTVYNGFISLTIWVIVFLVLSILFLKFRKG